ncbi:PAR bZIP family member Pdp1 isoform X5 [Haematobia irritans]|uniref:PAR bZIP family member Pdp1 isoform X5 n=1 Tax=Haematobia irritans TaxID=7368 RepID=UPI003F4FDBC9
MRDLSMRMDYQLPPQTLQLGSLMNNPLAAAAAVQHSGAQLQILQLNQQHHQQQQQQQHQHQHHQQHHLNQQQQHILNQITNNSNNNNSSSSSGNNHNSNHANNQQQTLPSLSTLPLQVVHNLPHLLAGGGSGGGGIPGGGGNNNLGVLNSSSSSPSSQNTNSSNNTSLNLLSNNLNLSPNNTNGGLNQNTNTSNNGSINNSSNSPTNINNNSGNSNQTHALLRNTMQHVTNANQQLQQTINNLSNNLVSSLPPNSQLLQHHLQHLANSAVVQLNGSSNGNGGAGGGGSSNGSGSNSSSPLTNCGNSNSNILLNNSQSNNNNNGNNQLNNNLVQHLSDNVVAHNLVNGLVGVLSNVQNNNSNVNHILGNLTNNNNSSNNSVNNVNNNNNNTSNNNNNNPNTPNLEDNNRWTQFQVQQLWKQHASYLNGKSTSNSKEVICPDDKYKEEGDLWNVEAQAAFLGPNLWEKTLPYDADLKVTQYADLDEFLSENNIPDGLPGTHLGHSSSLGHRSDSLSHAAGLSLGLGHITTKRERSPSPSDCISPDTLNPPSPAESMFDIPAFSFASSGRDFDPRTRAFSDEELKPQPMIKKSRKQFVPDELKDDKYWARRRKNNIAAKRSRDARRQKENQIAMRARYLEKENATLHQEVEQLKQENMDLRARLSKFQDV